MNDLLSPAAITSQVLFHCVHFYTVFLFYRIPLKRNNPQVCFATGMCVLLLGLKISKFLISLGQGIHDLLLGSSKNFASLKVFLFIRFFTVTKYLPMSMLSVFQRLTENSIIALVRHNYTYKRPRPTPSYLAKVIAVVRQQFVMGNDCSIFLHRNSFGANQRLALTRKFFRIVQVSHCAVQRV